MHGRQIDRRVRQIFVNVTIRACAARTSQLAGAGDTAPIVTDDG